MYPDEMMICVELLQYGGVEKSDMTPYATAAAAKIGKS